MFSVAKIDIKVKVTTYIGNMYICNFVKTLGAVRLRVARVRAHCPLAAIVGKNVESILVQELNCWLGMSRAAVNFRLKIDRKLKNPSQ